MTKLDKEKPIILDGKKLSEKIKNKLKKNKNRKKIILGTILVGNDPASNTYVSLKHKDCKEIGIKSLDIRLKENTSEKEIINNIEKFNNETTGFIVQMPLPKHINIEKIIGKIDPVKDADGIHPFNLGSINSANTPKPCTPIGIIKLLKEYKITISGKNAIIVGRSSTVGTPLSLLLLKENATVTIAHSKTKDLEKKILDNDIVVSATGVKNLITKIKPNAVVVDVGIYRNKAGKTIGDISNNAKKNASYTSLPIGGVGPMTRVSLLNNVFRLYEIQRNNCEVLKNNYEIQRNN